MNKYILPTFVAGLMLVGIGLAMNPVDQASAVHTTIQENTMRHFVLTGTITPDGAGADEAVTWTINQPFEILAVTAENTIDDGANCDLLTPNIRTDLMTETSIAELDPGLPNALDDSRNFIGGDITDAPMIGTTVLTVQAEDQATCAAGDTYTIEVVIKTTGSLTAAPTAVQSAIIVADAGGLAGD